MKMSVAGIEFDNVDYDSDADVLYLHIGDPATATDFEETPEGHGVRFDEAGEVVGLTIVRPKHLVMTQGGVSVTLVKPMSFIKPDQLSPVLD